MRHTRNEKKKSPSKLYNAKIIIDTRGRAVPKMVTCEYCGGIYPYGTLTCPHCGAPASAKR